MSGGIKSVACACGAHFFVGALCAYGIGLLAKAVKDFVFPSREKEQDGMPVVGFFAGASLSAWIASNPWSHRVVVHGVCAGLVGGNAANAHRAWLNTFAEGISARLSSRSCIAFGALGAYIGAELVKHEFVGDHVDDVN